LILAEDFGNNERAGRIHVLGSYPHPLEKNDFSAIRLKER
jgi:hypothetical protein